MTEDLHSLQAVKFPRYERRGLFMGLKWYQLALTAGGMLVASVASAIYGPFGLVGTGPLWLGLMLMGLLQYSRIPYPVWAAHAGVFFLRTVTHQTRYLAKPEVPTAAGHLILPGGLGSLELLRTGHGECFVVDSRGHEAIAVLRCSTRSFALLDADDKTYAVQAWSRVQAGMAQRPSIARVSAQDYTVPYPSTALRNYYDVVTGNAGEGAGVATWGDRVYLDLIAAAGSAMSHDLLVTLVLDTAKARRRIKDAGGGVVGLEHLIRSEVEAFGTGLRTHGVTVDEWLSDTRFAQVLRGAFDPAAVVGLAKNPAATLATGTTGAPMAVEEHWTYLRTDSGFHQTFWIAEWRRQQVFPGFMHPLIYLGDFRHTVTEVIRAVPTAEALRDIRSAQEAHETRRRVNTRFDRPLTREQRAEEEEVAAREEEIVAGHGDIRPAAYVTITAETVDDLARHRQALESAAAGAFVELRLLAGQQWAAFVAGALPLGRGLR